jgi:hypothetical protein
MDKAKLKEVLQELLQDQIQHMVSDESSDLTKTVNSAVKSAIDELQNSLVSEPALGKAEGNSSEGLVLNALQDARLMGANMVMTHQGSILDMGRRHTPWVKCSEEVEEWAKAFATYLKSKGKIVGKVLEESDDTAGGYELEVHRCPH